MLAHKVDGEHPASQPLQPAPNHIKAGKMGTGQEPSTTKDSCD